MKTIGITGGIGSGKTVVSQILSAIGIPVYDTDSRAKALYNTDPELKDGLIRLFGNGLYSDGVLNRPALAEIIFSSKEALGQINQLVHPAVRADFARWREVLTNQGSDLCAIESAIMLSSILKDQVDRVWVIAADLEERIHRAMLRDGATREQVEGRISHQMSQEEMISMADTVIYNDARKALLPQVFGALVDIGFRSKHLVFPR